MRQKILDQEKGERKKRNSLDIIILKNTGTRVFNKVWSTPSVNKAI